MSPEEGYALSLYQRPGFKVVMGPCEALSEPVPQVSKQYLYHLPGHAYWEDYDLKQLLGFVPCVWAKSFVSVAAYYNHTATPEEWVWLNGKCTLLEAFSWIEGLSNGQQNYPKQGT
jgi:hypothetical protein